MASLSNQVSETSEGLMLPWDYLAQGTLQARNSFLESSCLHLLT